MGTLRNTTSGSNLLTAIGGSVGAGDDIIISEGNETYNAGLNLDGAEANSVVVTKGFGGSLGVAGSPVEVDLAGSGDYLHYSGQGMAWFKADGTGTTIIKAEIFETGRGIFHCSGGTWTDLGVGGNSHVEVQAGAVVTNAYAVGARAFNVADNATWFSVLYIDGAEGLLERGATTSEFRNCNMRMDNRSRNLGTCTIGAGGKLQYNGGTLTKLIGKPGGVLDLTYQDSALTITNADLYRGFRVINPSNLPITWSNNPVLFGGGPEWYTRFQG